jgi:hypothetical protein
MIKLPEWIKNTEAVDKAIQLTGWKIANVPNIPGLP